MRANRVVVGLTPLDECLHERLRHLLALESCHEFRRLVRMALVEERCKHTVDVELVRIAQHLCKQQAALVVCRLDFFFIMVADGKAHKRLVLGCQLFHERQLREHRERERCMILRLRVVECLVKHVLAEAPDVMEEPHDFCERPVVRIEPELFCERDHVPCHVARMQLLDADALHDLFVRRVERLHVGRHPDMHFLQYVRQKATSFRVNLYALFYHVCPVASTIRCVFRTQYEKSDAIKHRHSSRESQALQVPFARPRFLRASSPRPYAGGRQP